MSKASAISSGVLSVGTTTVVDRKSYLNSCSLTGDGTNTATMTVYDNASAATGKIVSVIRINTAGITVHKEWNYPVRIDNGITVVVTGTGAQATLTYDAA